MVEEDNTPLGITFSFEYDNNGNILKRSRYYKSTKDTVSVEYDYTTVRSGCNHNAAWGDQLKTYNGEVVKYDKLGNITNYNGRRLEWKGKNLLSINGCVIMDYDHNGLRVKKTFGDCVKKYYWCDNRLIMERWNEDGKEKYLYFYYDESGVCGMRYDNGTIKEDYHYLKNIFGDIIGIYDRYGECICKYVYDTWGNHKVLDNEGKEINDNNNICLINPLRYRGYYYDTEAGIYYLQSRYYEPMIGRFLSPDTSAINPQSVSGFNTYAFCDNNPVGFAYSGSGIGGNIDCLITKLNNYPLIIPIFESDGNKNKSIIHWKNEWLSTGWPSFVVFSPTKGALIDWGLSVYKGALYFDEAEKHSIYVGIGNISAFIGYNDEKDKYGVFAEANVLSAGYDGRYIDASISVVGVGFIFGWEGKKFRIKIDPLGWFGFDISIDLGQIFQDIFR